MKNNLIHSFIRQMPGRAILPAGIALTLALFSAGYAAPKDYTVQPAPVYSAQDHLVMATFNIRSLGRAKMNHPAASAFITRLLSRFDVAAIQEYRDKSGQAVKKLLKMLNKSGRNYRYRLSRRFGKGKYKEQYLFIFDIDRVKPGKINFYRNSAAARPPVGLELILKDSSRMVVINSHLDPDRVVVEVNDIYNSLAWFKEQFGHNNLVVMGDLNADCSYFAEEQLLPASRKGLITWLVDNKVDTTLAPSDCTYDRIGTTFSAHRFTPGQALNFTLAEFKKPPVGLKSKSKAWRRLMRRAALEYTHKGRQRKLKPERISDHFPVVTRYYPGRS